MCGRFFLGRPIDGPADPHEGNPLPVACTGRSKSVEGSFADDLTQVDLGVDYFVEVWVVMAQTQAASDTMTIQFYDSGP